MASKIISEAYGSGMTRHTRRRRVFDCTVEWTAEDAGAFRRSFSAMGEAAAPWRWFEREIAIAERTLADIKAGKPGSEDPDIFEPHAGAGWYSKEILARAEWIENAIASEQWELVARFSYELGQLACAIRLKNAADDYVEEGRAHLENHARINEQNRLASDDSRKTVVKAIMAEKGCGVRQAVTVAASRHPEMGKVGTFKASYYKKPVQR